MNGAPNIVWLTVESLRYDHTSLGGYDRDTTPNLQRIAERESGVSVSQCISPAKWTGPSTASMLTGTYPVRHGVGLTNDVLPDSLDTVPGLLSEVGYKTRGISPNGYAGPATGLDRDFDEFVWLKPSNLIQSVGVSGVLRSLFNFRKHTGGFTLNTERHPTSSFLNSAINQWIRDLERGNDPYFIYAHYQDPHHAYVPPPAYMDRFTDDIELSTEAAVDVALDMSESLHEKIAFEDALSTAELDALEALYDGIIAYTDEQIGALFDSLQEHASEHTVFVVTGDHGDLFGEYGLVSHKLVLHDGLIHVPMVVDGFEQVAHQRGNIVQQLDVMRTLVDAVGADTSQFQGIDLREDTREYAISQRGERAVTLNIDEIKEINPEFDTSPFHLSMLYALRTADWKYLKSEKKSELHELPDDIMDVSAAYPEKAAKLDGILSEWVANHAKTIEGNDEGTQLSDELQEHLSNMGYIVN